MMRYLAVAATAGAATGLAMSLIYNGVEVVEWHAFNAIAAACYFMVPGFLIWLSMSRATSRRSD